MGKKIDRLGEENYNTHGTLMKIVEYNNANNIIVEFQDEYRYRKRCVFKEFKKGKVKNPYDKTVCGIGFLGKDDKCNEVFHNIWRHMIQRCYDPYEINKDKNLTYKDCFVCKEWHCFYNFEKWCYEKYYSIKNEKICLDKDILTKGNKKYSPENCVFVPERINLLFCKSDATRGKYPVGVSEYIDKRGAIVKKKLRTYCNVYDKDNKKRKIRHLGYFPINRPFQAFTCYKNFKENYIKQVADEYKDLIPKELYEALYRWEVEIND